jgi:hypothetical protein
MIGGFANHPLKSAGMRQSPKYLYPNFKYPSFTPNNPQKFERIIFLGIKTTGRGTTYYSVWK